MIIDTERLILRPFVETDAEDVFEHLHKPAVNTPEKIMLGIVVLVLESIMLDKTMIYGMSQNELFVISAHYNEICKKFLTELNARRYDELRADGCSV